MGEHEFPPALSRRLVQQLVYDGSLPSISLHRRRMIAVVGRSEGTDIYELLGERGTVAPAVLEARDRYETALAAYFARRFEEAAAVFRSAADLHPGDKAAEIMAHRSEQLALYQPSPEWDGVYVSSSK